MAKPKNYYDPNNCSTLAVLRDTLLLIFQIIFGYIVALVRLIVPVELKSLEGETIIITGGGHGIGKELAKQVSKLGIKALAIWDINAKAAEQTAKEIQEETGVKVKAIQCDVSDRDAVAQAAKMTRESIGRVSVLFNNAGIMPCKPLLKHTTADIDNVFKVNVYSQFWTLFEFLPDFLEVDRGHIVAMSSTAGMTGTPNLTAYCATKHAIKGLMEALYLELRQDKKDHNIKMTTVMPFTVNTGLAKKPATRFESLIPISEPDDAARIILEAMRRNETHVFIPRRLVTCFSLVGLMPVKVQLAIYDYLGCGVGEHE